IDISAYSLSARDIEGNNSNFWIADDGSDSVFFIQPNGTLIAEYNLSSIVKAVHAMEINDSNTWFVDPVGAGPDNINKTRFELKLENLISMTSNSSGTGHTDFNDTLVAGGYTVYYYVNDTSGNINSSEQVSFTFKSVDSCTYSSGDWDITCSDNCDITSNISIDSGHNISMTGTGIFTMNDGIKISNWKYRKVDASCYVVGLGTGGFYQ
ncbi:hypothetical protein IID20_02485, partial [Patescibacteria group bacterium]|nr:hypothetical protein [Patescibacteria group bacterium]